MSRVIVFDVGNIQFKAIFGYRNNTQIPATWLFMSMLTGYLNKLSINFDDTVIMAVDFGSWRKQVDKVYKAQRQNFRESFEEDDWWQARYKEFNDLYEKLKVSLPYHFIKIYLREADDIASVVCRSFPNKEIILVSIS